MNLMVQLIWVYQGVHDCYGTLVELKSPMQVGNELSLWPNLDYKIMLE